MMDRRSFVHCDNLIKIYQIADLEVIALQGLNLKVAQGEMIALIGPSGVGKSTLLNVIGGLDAPSAGEAWVAGWDLQRMTERARVRYKRQVVGFVWQQPARNLLPYLSARENIELPMQHNGVKPDVRRRRALELLALIGLAERADFRPERLSGGEQQRVALAVALANNPPLLLGDELTGQVDSKSAMQVFDAVQAINQACGTTVIIVTHDPRVAGRMDRVVTIRDGRTATEIRRTRNGDHPGVREEEWVILDPAGRLQLPQTHVDTLEMQELVRVHLEPDHISVWPNTAHERERREGKGEPEDAEPWPAIGAQWKEAGGFIRVEGLARTFDLGEKSVHALQNVSLQIPAGSLSAIKGPSGSGKTTLLNLMAGLDEPTAGDVRLGEQSLAEMSPAQKTDLVQRQIGFIFQTFGLLPFLTVRENVEVPLRLLYTPRQERALLVREVLTTVGLADRAEHRTYELSGGEQQRVAIARALVKRPTVIFADEPTGQLDTVTGANIVALLKAVANQAGVTVVIASHDPNVHEAAEWVFELQDGQLVGTVNQAHNERRVAP